MTDVYWAGSNPTHCQLSGRAMGDTMYDANLPGIGWGNWDRVTFERLGGKLGTGFGQKYKLQDDGRWKKVAG